MIISLLVQQRWATFTILFFNKHFVLTSPHFLLWSTSHQNMENKTTIPIFSIVDTKTLAFLCPLVNQRSFWSKNNLFEQLRSKHDTQKKTPRKGDIISNNIAQGRVKTTVMTAQLVKKNFPGQLTRIFIFPHVRTKMIDNVIFIRSILDYGHHTTAQIK